MADSASSTNALEADIREDCDELADGRSGRSAFLSDIKPSDQRCVTRMGRLCDLTGKLSLSTEEFRLVSMLILRIISIEKQNAGACSPTERAGEGDLRRDRPRSSGRSNGRAGVSACRSGHRPKDGDISPIRCDRQIGCRPRVTRGAREKTIGDKKGEADRAAGQNVPRHVHASASSSAGNADAHPRGPLCSPDPAAHDVGPGRKAADGRVRSWLGRVPSRPEVFRQDF